MLTRTHPREAIPGTMTEYGRVAMVDAYTRGALQDAAGVREGVEVRGADCAVSGTADTTTQQSSRDRHGSDRYQCILYRGGPSD